MNWSWLHWDVFRRARDYARAGSWAGRSDISDTGGRGGEAHNVAGRHKEGRSFAPLI